MNIFIVGPMGSGKSTVGKIISSELFLTFYDTDAEIESRTGASIDWIFDLEGEDGFRKRESKILEELAELNSIVLSTGGGIILSALKWYRHRLLFLLPQYIEAVPLVSPCNLYPDDEKNHHPLQLKKHFSNYLGFHQNKQVFF